ncbi:hypothetical protein [Roseimaritima ulvae]|uniref:Uncharacterized protein n=1 Tax=Roseimaritima ulvae TaxID=980254 RepID=A0A5B9QU69_9BACT|nr:hypothetical protein [Roseimaritima ulvae]QEG40586.1 hypothetical protein UC8_26010 [Roseimaritima ulvae]
MISGSETILSILPGSSEDVRTVVALCQRGADSAVEMRQESFSQAVGWFVQSRIELTGEQVAGLRQTLGLVSGRVRRPRPASVENSQPATLAFPSPQRAATA